MAIADVVYPFVLHPGDAAEVPCTWAEVVPDIETSQVIMAHRHPDSTVVAVRGPVDLSSLNHALLIYNETPVDEWVTRGDVLSCGFVIGQEPPEGAHSSEAVRKESSKRPYVHAECHGECRRLVRQWIDEANERDRKPEVEEFQFPDPAASESNQLYTLLQTGDPDQVLTREVPGDEFFELLAASWRTTVP